MKKFGKQKFKQEYKSLKFKTKVAFEKWLKKKTFATINFVDKGQDLLQLFIDKGGEVLHCNLQCSIWNGKLVSLSKLKKGNNLYFIDCNSLQAIVMDFVIKGIILK